jgi:ribulose-phosphate 3-epimerase
VKETRALINATGSKAQIEVDGGVGTDNARILIEAGANALVAGNAVFGSANPTETIKQIKNAGV